MGVFIMIFDPEIMDFGTRRQSNVNQPAGAGSLAREENYHISIIDPGSGLCSWIHDDGYRDRGFRGFGGLDGFLTFLHHGS